eukprot:TRINITY_DN787_c0_g1_i4.p1 TRINITY_DN787_c0_g1~~TRINITY_DN787_c0_g1_i4.p1  ORF type:complete len:267 (-),score=111.62 TRINITY_DN787_c0_g1_i4:247-1047(-)
MAVEGVKGMGVAIQQAEAGMALFKAEEDAALDLDVSAAETYKSEVEARIAALEAEAALLTGKDNKKERAAKGKQVSELKGENRYVDACKVAKGLEPKHGNFVKGGGPVKKEKKAEPAPAPAEAAPTPAKKETKKKKDEAGLTKDEEQELEKLKQDIIDRKTKLKAEGLSGGQQNKDEQIVAWVSRMNELKEKQDPGSTADKKETKKKASKAPLSSEEQKGLSQLEGEVEIYKAKLKNEFGYSKKDMAADPDLQEMEAKLKALQKRS